MKRLYKEYDEELLEKLHYTHIEMLSDIDRLCKKYNIQYFAVFGTALGAIRHKGFIPWDDDTDIGMTRQDYDKFLSLVDKEMGDKYQVMSPLYDDKCSSAVTKIQRKGTKFVSEIDKNADYEQCIFVDVFPYDFLPDDERLVKRQYIKTLVLDRLLFLTNHPKPIIPYSGIKYYIASFICLLIHWGLKVFGLNPRKLFIKFEKECKKYNSKGYNRITKFGTNYAMKYIMTYDEMFPLKSKDFETIQIPVFSRVDLHLERTYGDYMKLPPKEKRVNHAPMILQFINEEERRFG